MENETIPTKVSKGKFIPPGYDEIIHFETDDEMVIMSNGKTLNKAIEDGDIGAGGGGYMFNTKLTYTGSGILADDTLAERGNCIRFVASTSEIVLAKFSTDKVPLGKYAVCIRAKVSDNTLGSNIISFVAAKENNGIIKTTYKTANFTCNMFSTKDDYSCIYTVFDFNGGKLTGDKLTVTLNLLNNNGIEISLDYIMISPIIPSVFYDA